MWQALILFLKKYFLFVLFVLLGILANYALLHDGFFYLHDFTHASRITEMSQALQEGQWPVRWSDNFGYGFGMPLFNFYAPLPYFFGAIFDLLGFEVITSIKLLYLLCNLITMVMAFKFARLWLGRLASVIVSGVYLLAPYRAVNLFVRGAMSEVFAMAFFPWVLWAAWSFIQSRQKKYLLHLVLALAAIVLSHNLSALMFIPLSFALAASYLLYQKKIALIWPILSSYVLAFTLTAFYSLPSFLEKDFTQIYKIFAGYFHYSHHFLYIRQFFKENWQYGGSAWGPDDGISFFLGAAALLAIAALALFVLRQRKTFFRNKELLFWMIASTIALGASLFLTLLRSQWLWDRVSLLQYIQFPWRFLSIASLFLAILSGLSVQLASRFPKRLVYFILLLALLTYQSKYFKPAEYLDNPQALYYDDPQRIQDHMSEILPDYIPRQMAEEKILKEYADHDLLWVEQGDLLIKNEIMIDRAAEKLVLVNLKEDALLSLKIAAFPGWQIEVDGEQQENLVDPNLGNLQVRVTQGEHKVGAIFTQNTWPRQLGNTLSAASLLLMLYLFFPFDRSGRNKSTK